MVNTKQKSSTYNSKNNTCINIGDSAVGRGSEIGVDAVRFAGGECGNVPDGDIAGCHRQGCIRQLIPG